MSYFGEKGEQTIFAYFKEHYDADADCQGGMDSTGYDIMSPKYGIVEAKSLPARCGQFTYSTAYKYQYSNEVMLHIDDEDVCKKWVLNYYTVHKHVNYFMIKDKDEFYFLTPTEFINKYHFSCPARDKKSGTSKAAKWVMKYVPPEWNCVWKNGKLYALNKEYYNAEVVGYNTQNTAHVVFVSPRCDGEVRIKSNTKNFTFIFSVH
jgi:hypothetical protein